jgi:hypothetical protein
MFKMPCKTCGHKQYHMLYFPKDPKYRCEDKKCKCVWYESMTNLEYLEWLYNSKVDKIKY